MNEICNALFDKFFKLLMRRDGWGSQQSRDVAREHAEKRETAILNQWKDLECLVGRTVSHDEIWNRYTTNLKS